MNKLELSLKSSEGYLNLTACLCRAIETEDRLLDRLVDAAERNEIEAVVNAARELAELRRATMTEENCVTGS
jgi:hypothetical protein